MHKFICPECRDSYEIYSDAWHCCDRGPVIITTCPQCGKTYTATPARAEAQAADCCKKKKK